MTIASAGPPLGSRERPLRVAIVGSGPAGFYAADWLFREKGLHVEIDMFERLPAPFGLVRFGVAPDHQKIKRAAAAFERTAGNPSFRFLGNVCVGKDLSPEELTVHYDQVLYASGSATDRRLAVPGEDLIGSHAATAFVGWYNGHPDFRDESFDLTSERAVIVGMGNVALDVARILIRRTDELAETDIAGYALDALRKSQVREVVLLGRRGPAQAAFDQSEVQDIAELADVAIELDAEPVRAALGQPDLELGPRKNVAYLNELLERGPRPAKRRMVLRFLTSPVELIDDSGRVSAIKIEHNVLVQREDGSVSPKGTGKYETIETGLVMRSIGYHGVAIHGVPFDERSGTIPNVEGRVCERRDGPPISGLYAVGWIKRGPTGLIGTNKSDAKETVARMLEDVPKLAVVARPARAALDELLSQRGVHVVTFPHWRTLDALEIAAGKKLGKIREKFYSIEAMLAALKATPSEARPSQDEPVANDSEQSQ